MGLVLMVVLVLAGVVRAENGGLVNNVGPAGDRLADSDVVLAFVVFRHGDRTPDQEELDLYSSDDKYKDVFFPYGMKALTNKGKQRGYLVGDYLRRRYYGFLSRLYLPDQITVRTTEYARTKMTALTALSALYPPLPSQKWNPNLDWQPVPYNTVSADIDDLLYWYNCPQYLQIRDQVYDLPEMKALVKPYQNLFSYLSNKTGNNITKPEDVFFLDNLFQTLENVGMKPPKWAQDVMPQIKEMTKIEYAAEFFTPDLVKLASGVLMREIINATQAAVAGDIDQPKLRLYSAHENNVAALMAAAHVFKPHQPNYGATFSLELRKRRSDGGYGITAAYSRNAGGPAEILPIQGCQDALMCEYDTFVLLVQDVLWSQEEFRSQCPLKN